MDSTSFHTIQENIPLASRLHPLSIRAAHTHIRCGRALVQSSNAINSEIFAT